MTPQRTAEAATEIPHVIREATPDERRFIVETTAKVRQPRGIPWRAWEQIGRSAAQLFLTAGNAYVIDAGGAVLAFLLVAAGVVEMLYVKRDFRGEGFGRKLLEHAGFGVTIPVSMTTSSFRTWCRASNLKWREVTEDEAGTVSPPGGGGE